MHKRINTEAKGFDKIMQQRMSQHLEGMENRMGELQLRTNDALKKMNSNIQATFDDMERKWAESTNKLVRQMETKFQFQ